jgi:hypothetical protein
LQDLEGFGTDLQGPTAPIDVMIVVVDFCIRAGEDGIIPFPHAWSVLRQNGA